MQLTSLATLAFITHTTEAILGPTGPVNSTTPTANAEDRTVHYITVGKETNEFMPNSIVANVGDIVSFQFYPLNHSVIRSAYGWPCIPVEDSPYTATPFFSGFWPIETNLQNPPVWNLTVNTTDPIWFYCGAPGSCIDWGMLGVINANAEESITTQIALAREAQIMLLPGQQFPSEQAEASFSRLAHSATTTVTQTVKPTRSSTATTSAPTASEASSSGLSTGAVVGIAVGVAAAALILAAFSFLVYRTRHLKRKLDRERAATTRNAWDTTAPLDFRTSHGGNRDLSQMSPKRSQYYSPVAMKEDRIPSWEVDGMHGGLQSPPLSHYNNDRYSKPQYSLNHPQPFGTNGRFDRVELDASSNGVRGNGPGCG